ncbi:MAG: tRNA-intron lyase [Desulfurococcales archaeon]|nr:tRNA-intron lyase [Desulfurococcales archaeon]
MARNPPYRAVLLANTVIVPDLNDSKKLFEKFYGKPVGTEKPKPGDVETPLVLDPLETFYLAKQGVIEVYDKHGQRLSREELEKWAESRLPRFKHLYKVYESLRMMGFVVRPGLKFGADFTVYRRGPGLEHSLFIVNVYPLQESIDPVELVKAGRLSHSVRKTFVLASLEGGEPVYLMFKWFKP